MELIVAEWILGGAPYHKRVGLWHVDDGENLLGDGVVDPAEDALVHKPPLGIVALLASRRRRQVSVEAKLADEDVEEGEPVGVVGLSELKDDGDMRLDVNHLERGGWWRLDGGGSVGFTVKGGRGRISGVGDIGVEEWVDVHGRKCGEQWRKVAEGR